ncbi:MAG: DivIVA domain-containing protein [Melioribacteraceae bacterium]|nr:DivIVA domain-containing protein [Melioribacteraceae bacterium]
MKEIKKIYYATPALLAVLLIASNFLNTDLFKAGFQNFSVWFVLSVFAFAIGWLTNKTLGYNFGGKIIFSVIVASSVFSIILVTLFKEYFGLNDLLVESLVLFILRNITLGSMSFFGMVVCELLILQKELAKNTNKEDDVKKALLNAQREAQIAIEEAKLKADKMLFEVQKNLNDMIDRKNQVERRLKEFIQTERELLKQYEKDEE